MLFQDRWKTRMSHTWHHWTI